NNNAGTTSGYNATSGAVSSPWGSLTNTTSNAGSVGTVHQNAGSWGNAGYFSNGGGTSGTAGAGSTANAN
ncbi:hypothetical protein P365_04430, partial [Comamonas thiooxydans]